MYFYVRCNIGINFVTLSKDAKSSRPCFISLYYMVSPVCEQDETNPDWARWHYLTCLGLPTACHNKKFPESHIMNPLFTKLVQSRWLDIGLILFCSFMDLGL